MSTPLHPHRARTGSEPPVEARLGEAFSLRIGQEARLPSESLTLLFQSVPEDSRCPEEEHVDCVWAGNAIVRLEAVKGAHASEVIDLNTTLEPRQGSYLEYEIQLLSLAPGTSASELIAPERYLARLLVTEADPPAPADHTASRQR